MPEFDVHRAGKRLAAAVTEAYGKPGRVRNQSQLSERSGVSRTVLDGWWKGAQPKPDTMQRVAGSLGVPVQDLWLRWLDYDPPELGLSLIAKEIRSLRRAISWAGGDDRQLRDARVAVGAAQEDSPQGPAEGEPSEPDASAPPSTPDAGTQRQ